MSSRSPFAALLNESQRSLGLSLQAFAEMLEVNAGTLEHWKCGTLMPGLAQRFVILERIEREVKRQSLGAGPAA
jgi:hypothetical protein